MIATRALTVRIGVRHRRAQLPTGQAAKTRVRSGCVAEAHTPRFASSGNSCRLMHGVDALGNRVWAQK